MNETNLGKKIPNLFKRDVRGIATPEINPECEWALTSQTAKVTRLWDGRGYFIDDKKNAFSLRGDGMFPVAFDDHIFVEAFKYFDPSFTPWTFELIGPHIKKNSEGSKIVQLIPHGRLIILVNISYKSIRNYFPGRNIAGLVVWEDVWDYTCRKAKVRQEDFGFVRNKHRRAE